MSGDDGDWIPILSGRAWMLGLDAPASLLGQAAENVLTAVDPEFPQKARAGDILVAARFADGSRGDATVRALMDLGIGAVLADAFDPAFEESARRLGLRAAVVNEVLAIRTGDELRVDFEGSRISNRSTGDRYPIRNLDDQALADFRSSIARADA